VVSLGRSLLARSYTGYSVCRRHACAELGAGFIWSIWSIWSVSFVWLNQTDQIDQVNQTNHLSHGAP
jgi:hypothetical protein